PDTPLRMARTVPRICSFETRFFTWIYSPIGCDGLFLASCKWLETRRERAASKTFTIRLRKGGVHGTRGATVRGGASRLHVVMASPDDRACLPLSIRIVPAPSGALRTTVRSGSRLVAASKRGASILTASC